MPIAAPVPHNEQDRIAALRAMNVLDTPPDPRLDRITKLAAQIFAAPICLVSLVDTDRQWFKSRFGLDATETPRCLAFCAYAILGDELFVVPDATADPRFADSPLVVGPPHIRTYVGAPLVDPEGFRLGTLCLIYDQVTAFSAAQSEQLKTLAAVVVDGLRLLRRNRTLIEANAEIVRQRRLFEAVEKMTRVGGWVLEREAKTVSWSAQIYDILEVDPGFSPNLENALHFYPADARETLTDVIRHSFDAKTPFNLELPVLTAKGRPIWVHTFGQPVVEDGVVTKLVGAFQDITARKAFEDEQRDRRAEAEAANDAKSHFLASMSHEIRTSINAITGMAAALLRDELSAKQSGRVQVINDSSNVLLHLLNDILDLSKVEAGQIELEHIAFDLGLLADSIESVFKLKAEEKQLSFRVTCSDDARSWFVGDPTRLRQVFNNLISNALKFTDVGGVDVAIDIKATGQKDVFDLMGSVRDTGPGIAPDVQEAIFSDFVQADSSVSRRHGGTGLGLSISRSLCHLMGGDIAVESEVGVGSTFAFTARVRVADEEAVATPELKTRAPHVEEPATSSTQEMAEAATEAPVDDAVAEDDDAADAADAGADDAFLRVLIAEDNANNRAVFSALLEPFELDVTFAENGRQAVDMWADRDFDLILMDVQMPIMTGVEATREIRAREAAAGAAAIPIIAVTANVMKHQLDEYAEAGMDCCVGKPIRLGELIDAINRAIADTDDPGLEDEAPTEPQANG